MSTNRLAVLHKNIGNFLRLRFVNHIENNACDSFSPSLSRLRKATKTEGPTGRYPKDLFLLYVAGIGERSPNDSLTLVQPLDTTRPEQSVSERLVAIRTGLLEEPVLLLCRRGRPFLNVVQIQRSNISCCLPGGASSSHTGEK
jgi:hypothetical protein